METWTEASYQTSATSGTTTLFDFIAVAADLHKHNTQSLCFGDEALQELRPAARVAAHGRVYPANVLISICPCVAHVGQVHVELLVGLSEDVDVDEIVVEQRRHAANGAFDYHVAFEELGAIRAVFEQAVEFVDVLHGDLEALVAEQHVLHAALEVLVGTLQEAVELVDMLEQDVGDIGHRLFQVLVQQVDAEDDLRNRLGQGVELALWVVSPMAAICKVPRGLEGLLLSAQQLLTGLDPLLGAHKGDMARFAGGIEHRLLKGRLHRGDGMDGEGGRHDAVIALVLPCVGVALVEAAAASLGRAPQRDHGDIATGGGGGGAGRAPPRANGGRTARGPFC